MKLRFAPFPTTGAEADMQRAAFALVIVLLFPFRDYASFELQRNPQGFAHLIDFTFLSNPSVFTPLWLGMFAAAALYAFGRLLIPATTYLLFITIACGTLANSQGTPNHATQIVPLVLLVQLIAFVQRRKAPARSAEPGRDDLALYYTIQAVAAAYVTSGIMKLIRSEGLWIAQLPDIAVQVVKTHGQHYANTLDASMLERGEAIGRWITEHPNLVRVVFGSALFLELFAFIAALNRPLAAFIGLGLWFMHAAINWTMVLEFSMNQWVLLIYLVNAPYLCAEAYRLWKKRLSAMTGSEESTAIDRDA